MTNHTDSNVTPLHPADHPVFANMPNTQEALRSTFRDIETRRFDGEHLSSPFVVTTVEAPRMQFMRFISEDDKRSPHSHLNVHGVTNVTFDQAMHHVIVTIENGEQVRLNIFPADGGMTITRPVAS